MNAGKINIEGLFNSGRRFEIPFYQRPYVWEEEQWDRLLDDLAFISSSKRPYFIGSIILKKAPVQTWESLSDRKIVVDGQQRLTTLVTFFKVFCKKTNDMELFNRTFTLRDNSLSLNLGMYDDPCFKTVIEYDKDEPLTSESTSNILNVYNYFQKNVDPQKYNINTILQNLQMVCIDLDEDEDEQQVFDTINSLGVRLTTAELLKNYFYSREDIELYKKNWVKVFEKDDDTRSYWNQEFEAGRITRSMIDLFFDSYFQLFVQDPKYKVSTEDKIVYGRLDHLAQSYQDFIRKYCENKQTVLEPMADYANKFREIFDPSILNRQISKESNIQRINVVVFGLKNTTLIPYVLYVAMNSGEEELNTILLILESYMMRRIITRTTTKNYNNLFSSLILNRVTSGEVLLAVLKKNSDTTTYVPSDVNLEDGFNNSKLTNLQAKGVIYFIETNLRSSKDALAMLGFNQYSLEHLMPRKWRNHWKPCDSIEEARNRDNKLATLGNFAIITQALNTSISDSEWMIKKSGNKGNPGLDQCASGLLTMGNVLSENEWDESKIETRAKWLFDKAKDIWASVLPAVNEGGTSNRSTQPDDTKALRKRFWEYALPLMQAATVERGTFTNCTPITGGDVFGRTGHSGFYIDCTARLNYASVIFYLAHSDSARNKDAFDLLFSHKDEIEKKLGISLSWARANEKKSSWISYHLEDVGVANEANWEKITQFFVEWGKKFGDVFIPYLGKGEGPSERGIKVGSWIREWTTTKPDIRLYNSKCNNTYTRFLTDTMSEILPDIEGVYSSWGVESHYFYEIYFRQEKKISLQLAINSKDITNEFRAICDKIQEYYPSRASSDSWTYRLPFTTKPMDVDENTTKEMIFEYLDNCWNKAHAFESDLKLKLIN